MATSPLDHKKQLAQCLVELAERARELNEHSIQAILMVVAGSIADRSEDELALLCADYARLRLLILDMENKKESPEGDSDDSKL